MNSRGAGASEPSALETARREARSRIRRLRIRGTLGIWGLGAFLALSLAARSNFALLPTLSASTRDLLGAAPPAHLIDMALIAYGFSAIVLALSKMMSGAAKYGGLAHLGYLTGFFVFYHFAEAMEDRFWAVFAAGVTILVLEGYALHTRCQELADEEREKLALRETRERFGR